MNATRFSSCRKLFHYPFPFKIAAASAGVLCVLVAVCSSQEWTRYRGPNGSGQSDASGIPTQWTADDYRWVADLPGIGHSSPVIWQDRVFIQSADEATGQQFVVQLNAQDGSIAWKKQFGSTTYHIHARNSFASSTPAVDAEHVYAAWATPEQMSLVALDHQGQEIWSRHDLGPYFSQHGFASSPIVVQDIVVLCNLQMGAEDADGVEHSCIMGFDKNTGELRWQTPRVGGPASYSVPCFRTNRDGEPEIITCSTTHGIFAINPLTGEPTWSVPNAFSMRTVSSPIVVGNYVFGSTGSGAGGNYVVAAHVEGDHQIAYKIERQAPYVPTPVASADDALVFLWSDQGIVTCIETETGKTVWTQRVGGNYSGSPIRVGPAIYCIDEQGTVVVLAAAGEYKLLGKVELGGPSRSTPAVSDGKLYLRTYSKLFCLNSKS